MKQMQHPIQLFMAILLLCGLSACIMQLLLLSDEDGRLHPPRSTVVIKEGRLQLLRLRQQRAVVVDHDARATTTHAPHDVRLDLLFQRLLIAPNSSFFDLGDFY
jgi:hypothetical protein